DKLAVFDKTTGQLQYSNTGRALFENVNHAPCQIGGDNDGSDDYDQLASGDGVVLYDRNARRWLLSQWPLLKRATASGGANHTPGDTVGGVRRVCLAISSTSNALGSYYRYSFDLSNVLPANAYPDYPKVGIWRDGYYYTADVFDFSSVPPHVIGT